MVREHGEPTSRRSVPEDPTIDFRLITSEDVRNARYTRGTVRLDGVTGSTVFVKTSQGNYAKLQFQGGDVNRIQRLTVYNSEGCIVKSASDLVVRAPNCFDVDAAEWSEADADLRWVATRARAREGRSYHDYYGYSIEPLNGVSLHLYREFDDVTFDELCRASYQSNRVERDGLQGQTIFCRTRGGHYAKLFVDPGGGSLHVRHLVVYGGDGTVCADKTNVSIPLNAGLDLDAVVVWRKQEGTGYYVADVDASGVGGPRQAVDTGPVPRTCDLMWQGDSESRCLQAINGAEISYESYFRMEKYDPLLGRRSIRNAMVFEDKQGSRDYGQWTDDERAQLKEFIYLREMGRRLPIAGPPAVISSGTWLESASDAWKIYLAHVAQSLWADANRESLGISWQLADASREHLEYLFDSRRLLEFTTTGGCGSGFSFSFHVMGAVTHWDVACSFDFLVREGIVRANQWATIQALVEWCRINLTHITCYDNGHGGPYASQEDQYETLFGYRGLPPVDRMIEPLPGRAHVTHGCWGTSGFSAAVLRTVNIPVRHGRTQFEIGQHSRPEFFTVGQTLAHGDDPYNDMIGPPTYNVVPIDRIFFDDESLRGQIDQPQLLKGKSLGETASFNHGKKFLELAIEFKTDYVLRLRCADRDRGDMHWLTLNLAEYYTDEEIAEIARECDDAIEQLPGGCQGADERYHEDYERITSLMY